MVSVGDPSDPQDAEVHKNGVPTGGTAGQVLTSDANGVPTWQTTSPGGVQSVVAGTLITVDSTDPSNPIVNGTAELPSGGTAGQVLTTDGAGNVSWADNTDANFTTALTSTDGTVTLVATTNASGGTDYDLSVPDELPTGGTVGQVLQANGDGTVSWVTPTDSDAQTLSLSGYDLTISGGNTVTLPKETVTSTNGSVTVTENPIGTYDLAVSGLVPTGGLTGQVLTTNADGTTSWQYENQLISYGASTYRDGSATSGTDSTTNAIAYDWRFQALFIGDPDDPNAGTNQSYAMDKLTATFTGNGTTTSMTIDSLLVTKLYATGSQDPVVQVYEFNTTTSTWHLVQPDISYDTSSAVTVTVSPAFTANVQYKVVIV